MLNGQGGGQMLTPEERALANHYADVLIALYVERDTASKAGDTDRVDALQEQITQATHQREQLLAHNL
jgi:hypothetical protein